MFSDFWFDRFLKRARLPYPVTLAVISALLYGAGVALSACTANLTPFLGDRWIILSILGVVFGTAVTYPVRGFSSAIRDTRSLSRLTDHEFDDMGNELGA